MMVINYSRDSCVNMSILLYMIVLFVSLLSRGFPLRILIFSFISKIIVIINTFVFQKVDKIHVEKVFINKGCDY